MNPTEDGLKKLSSSSVFVAGKDGGRAVVADQGERKELAREEGWRVGGLRWVVR